MKTLTKITLNAVFLLFAAHLNAAIFVESSSKEVEPLTAEECASYLGKWVHKDSDVIILVESVKPDGKTVVKVFGMDGVTVKKATASRYLGAILMLTIETAKGDKPYQQFSLMMDGKELAGTCMDIAAKTNREVTFKLKEDTRVSTR